MGPPSAKEIEKIARRTTDIVKEYITQDVCVFGGAGAYLWADIGRVPLDVDIVVNTSIDAERVKEIIVEEDDRYYLEPSRFVGNTFHKLKCRLPGWQTDGHFVKVDILTSGTDISEVGTLLLPEIPASETYDSEGIPVMPLFDLLVLKAQGWSDHSVSSRKDHQAKARADVGDIDALLDCAKQEGVRYNDEYYENRHSEEFMDSALELAERFVSVNRWSLRKWKAIGFPL